MPRLALLVPLAATVAVLTTSARSEIVTFLNPPADPPQKVISTAERSEPKVVRVPEASSFVLLAAVGAAFVVGKLVIDRPKNSAAD